MENKRPTLNDPAEFAIVKSMYFKERESFYDKLDPKEEMERWESKQRNKNKSSR